MDNSTKLKAKLERAKKLRGKKGKESKRKSEKIRTVPINGHHDYVFSMVQKIEELVKSNPGLSFEEIDDIVLNDEELREFSDTQTSIYLVLTKTTDPDRFKKIYSLVDLKRRVTTESATHRRRFQL